MPVLSCHTGQSNCRLRLRTRHRAGVGSQAMGDERHDWFLNQIFRHRAALHRYLRKFTSGAEDVEDLVQETYVRMYALRDFREIESPRALLVRIAHNTAVERARRRAAQTTDSVGAFDGLNVYSSEAPADEQID